MINYRNAKEDDMKEVAKVHLITQPEYFTSTLGIDLLTYFYTEFLCEDNLFIVAVDDQSDRIVGFCMGNWYGSRAEKNWEIKYKKQIIIRLIIKCFQLNRLAISRVFRRLKGYFIKDHKNSDIYFAHLLSLGVLPEYRGRHIASKMIDVFEERCLEKAPINCVTNCTIGAYKWNKAGCNLYTFKGYSVYDETKMKLKFTKDLCN